MALTRIYADHDQAQYSASNNLNTAREANFGSEGFPLEVGQSNSFGSYNLRESFIEFPLSALSGQEVTDVSLAVYLTGRNWTVGLSPVINTYNVSHLTINSSIWVKRSQFSGLTLLGSATLSTTNNQYIAFSSSIGFTSVLNSLIQANTLRFKTVLATSRFVSGTNPASQQPEYVTFRSIYSGGTTTGPYIDVTHVQANTIPTITLDSPANLANISTPNPVVSVRVTDPDAESLYVFYQIDTNSSFTNPISINHPWPAPPTPAPVSNYLLSYTTGVGAPHPSMPNIVSLGFGDPGTPLSPGTYWRRARVEDNESQSDWTAARSFTITRTEKVRVGTSTPSKIMVGHSEASAVYVGTTKVLG